MRKLLPLFLIALALWAAAPAFEVASLKGNKPGTAGIEGKTEQTIEHSPLSLTISSATLAACIKYAWYVEDFQLVGAPAWLASERYDIAEKDLRAGPGKRPPPDVQNPAGRACPPRAPQRNPQSPALRAHSKQRRRETQTFHRRCLAFHASRRWPPRLPQHHHAGIRPALRPAPPQARPPRHRPHRPCDFSLALATGTAELKSALEAIDRGDSNGPSISEVVQAQLGLKLDPQKGNVEVLVIERIDRVPAAN